MAKPATNYILALAQALAIIVAAITTYRVVDHVLTKGDLGPQFVVVIVAIVNAAGSAYALSHHVHERERDDVNDHLDREEATKHERT